MLFCALATSLSAQWVKQNVDTKASFRGLSVVSDKIAWASGTGGTVIRTIDGGKTWKVMTVPSADKLDFRDIEAFDANTAYILSIGNGESSRIFKTIDGGATWNLQFKNTDPKAFFDAIACWDRQNCIAMSDPVEGHYFLISTSNGGADWKPIVSNLLPSARDGETAFAASGTCLISEGKRNAFIVSGENGDHIFRSTDRGQTWASTTVALVRGTGAAMFDAKIGVVVGGDYQKPEEYEKNLAFTNNGGITWKLGTGLTGYRSGVTYIDKNTIIAVGTNGSDLSSDAGKTWQKIGNENLNVVQAKGRTAAWAAGPDGLVVKLK
jgi:photosystem II stability/assembly factor-like uncharacterized protein